MLWDVPPLRVGKEDLVDSVIGDAAIYYPGGSHLGAFPGLLLSANHHWAVWRSVLNIYIGHK